jgi:hypothetical protein
MSRAIPCLAQYTKLEPIQVTQPIPMPARRYIFSQQRPVIDTEAGLMSVDAATPLIVKIDLHGYHPSDFIGPPMATIIEQAWEMGADRLRFVHGHARAPRHFPGIFQYQHRLFRPAESSYCLALFSS